MKFANLNIKPVTDLIPAIVTDAITGQVLMLGYMNEEAFNVTIESKQVTFFSRSKQRLWTKGETSGNTLELQSIVEDCDQDTLLIRAKSNGPTCHTGTVSCFDQPSYNFLSDLEGIIQNRFDETENSDSYVQKMKQKGLDKIAQKVGEEAVEVVIEAKNNDSNAFLNESADLLFHFLLLLKAKGHTLDEVLNILDNRHRTH